MYKIIRTTSSFINLQPLFEKYVFIIYNTILYLYVYRNIILCTHKLDIMKYTILKRTITVRPIFAEDNFT